MVVLRPLPMCVCTPRCSYPLIENIRKEREEDRIIRFLEGLNEEFDPVKSEVLVMEPLPSLDKVFKMAFKLERKLVGSNLGIKNEGLHIPQAAHVEGSFDENMTAIVSHSGFSNNAKRFNNGKSTAKCTFCGMSGHTIDKCYKKHGYPLGWVQGFKSKGKQTQSVQQGPGNSVNQVGDLGMSNEQVQRLFSLFQNQLGQNIGSSSTAANVTVGTPSLASNFQFQNEETNKGTPWVEGWLC